MKYAVVIEQGPTSFGATVADLPGCIAVAATRAEVERLIQEAIALHVAELRHAGLPLPTGEAGATTVQIR
jgi:predicted RNase H-like HicB family nuclease